MKRKLFSLSCCLVLMLAGLFTSCQQEAPEPEMVTVSYVSKFGTLAKTEKIVEKGYKLTAEDLPVLTENGYTFDKWYINNEEAKVGVLINKDTILVAKWKINTPVFTSFTIPTCKKGQKGNKIVATVAGANFKADGVTTEKFTLECTEKAVVNGASVEIVDDKNLKISLTVPETVGTFIVTISMGKNKQKGTFVVEDSALIGDILLNDGNYVSVANLQKEQKANAIAVVCGFNGNGKTLGLGLKQSEEKLQWASSGTGYDTKFTDIICTPSGYGSDGTADTATFTGDIDGSDNWSVIHEKDPTGTATEVVATNYPAFNWVNTYGKTDSYKLPESYKDGWYMPSIYELTEYIYKNREVLNQALTALGETVATPLTISGIEFYWSSSQIGFDRIMSWRLMFGDAFLGYAQKSNLSWVRSVRAF